MKVYIASFFADKERVAARGEELKALGITPTMRWPSETAPHTATIKDYPHDYFRETAVLDVEDILAADVLVLTVPTDAQMADLPVRSLTRGGRVFESGLLYGLILAAQISNNFFKRDAELVLCGPRENVFHFLDGVGIAAKYPAIKQCDTWSEVKEYLVWKKSREEE